MNNTVYNIDCMEYMKNIEDNYFELAISGSSRIACYELEFDFAGCELDQDYWNDQELRFKEFLKAFHNEFYIPEDENFLFK